MRRTLPITAVVLALTGGATTTPTTRRTIDPSIARSFAELADPDPDVRNAARDGLMALSANPGLPQLLAAVRAAGPLRPEQVAALSEIVRHVRLADEPYDVASAGNDDSARYILGQDWPGVPRDQVRLGVAVVHRWPGFPSRRLLRDGDLILGLYNDPAAPADRQPDVPTHQVEDLVEGMRDCPTRPLLSMAVLRDGRTIRVTGTMVAEPSQTVGRRAGAVAGFLADRQRVADDYWQSQFAPLLDPAPPATGPAPAADNAEP